MKLATLIEFLRARLKLVIRISIAALVLLVLWDTFLVDKEHAHTDAERFWGFWSFFGFFGCVAIILASKWFGHSGIMKWEDYYDE